MIFPFFVTRILLLSAFFIRTLAADLHNQASPAGFRFDDYFMVWADNSQELLHSLPRPVLHAFLAAAEHKHDLHLVAFVQELIQFARLDLEIVPRGTRA